MTGRIDNTERNKRIIAMRKAGKWPREIAADMGLSKNIVIGVCNRAGLSEAGNSALGFRAALRAGVRVNGSKLTADIVSACRQRVRLHSRQHGIAALAREHGVATISMWLAIRGHSWAHIK